MQGEYTRQNEGRRAINLVDWLVGVGLGRPSVRIVPYL